MKLRPTPLRIISGLSCIGAIASALDLGCSSSEARTKDPPVSSPNGLDASSTTFDAGESADVHADAADAGPTLSTCELTRAYNTACARLDPEGTEPLTCGDEAFDAWCAANDTTINSVAFRRAESLCLDATNCDGLRRRACEYASYATATPTDAQKKIVAAYCETCEPGDAAGCAIRKTTYDADAGPRSTDDVFIAAWELADPIVDEIREKCTGGALDAGADAGACLATFADCAADVYLNHLPDCP